MSNTRVPLLLLLLLATWAESVCAASQLLIVEATPARLVIDVHTPVHQPVAGPNTPQVRGAGGVALPMVAELLAGPLGAPVQIDVRALSTQTMSGIDLPQAHQATAEHPGVLAQTAHLGVMRGVDAHALRIYPFSYDAQQHRLTVHERLRVTVRFSGSSARRPAGNLSSPSPLHRAFINPPRHDGWRRPTPAARPAQDQGTGWYDPSLTWVKVFVETDGIHRITAAQLELHGIDPNQIDATRLRLVRRGVDQPVSVSGSEDGRLDAEDEILFVGRYRRAPDHADAGADPDTTGERDHENEFGRTQTYWLTWEGDAASPSFAVVSGAPTNNYPALDDYLHREHREQDRAFAILEEASEVVTDRWFWQNDRPLRAADPDVRATQTIIARISGLPDQVAEYDARLRVAVTGETPAIVGDHHAFLTLNQQPLAEAVWRGQTSHLFDETFSSSLLKGRNELLFQAQADLALEDRIWFNWFELTYRRQFHAYPGELTFPTEPAPEGHRITVEGFRHPDVVLFDVTGTRRLTDLQVTLEDSLYSATFEDVTPETGSEPPSTYVIADSLSIHQPELELDSPSDLRRSTEGAQVVIISSADFLDAAERLADHRRTQDGLSVQVVSMQDIFDEYNHGLFARQPLAAFLADIYQRWTPRPTFVLLFGDTTWDYRGIRASHREYQLVPTLYYHARDRGYSPSDHLLSLVEGDDQLPDLVIGRLPVDSETEAQIVVDKIIDYDTQPAAGDWRGRAILGANAGRTFVATNDSIAARHLEPVGLRPARFYLPDDEDLPNLTSKAFLDALNEGSLVLNFAGHGGVGSMHFLLSAEFPDWDYMSQISNGPRLPLITALSCLNGRFTEPTAEGLSEQFVELPGGGAIAYVSATAVSLTAQNELLSEFFYDALIGDDPLPFGAALAWAKARMLSVHTSFVDVPLTMQLTGDPMQRLALHEAPDYRARGLRIDADPVLSSRAQPVVVLLGNDARRGADSVRVQLVASSTTGADTLLDERRPAFVGDDSLRLAWQPATGGDYRLHLSVDTDDRTIEIDEGNNTFELSFQVLLPRQATPLWPPAEAAGADLQLQALTTLDEIGLQEGHLNVVEFALSSSADFDASSTTLQTATTSHVGLAQIQATGPANAAPGDLLYWRTRLIDGSELGPWSASRTLRWTEDDLADSVTAPVQWAQQTTRLLQLDGRGLSLRDNQLTATAQSPPFRMNAATRDIAFTVLSLPGAGVLATDGTYLYAKRWFNDPSTIYGGTDVFSRIGTGFQGSIFKGDYGTFPATTTDSTTGEIFGATTAGIAATWHDGYIYSDAGMSYAIERIDPVSGRLDTVAVPDGLLDWLTGRVVTDENRQRGQVLHAMFTSDGKQIYNVSMSSEQGTRVGWGVRVFDVDSDGNWRLQREFIIPPTEDGFTFRWTDGVIADGERLYLMEFGGERRIRMVDAETGAFLDEWLSDQDATRSITGQYDPTNDLVWLGDLRGPGLYAYPRDGVTPAGELTSDPIGPAATWGAMEVTGQGARVQVEGRRADGTWETVASGTAPVQIELTGVDASRYRHLRLQSQIGPDTTQTLTDWSVSWGPAADLALRAASADVVAGQLLVQTWVRNIGLAAAGAADLTLKQGTQMLAQATVPSLPRGHSARVAFEPIPLPETGEGLLLQLTPSSADGTWDNDALELVLSLPGLTTITYTDHISGHRLMDGDVLSAEASIQVLAPPLAAGRLELWLDADVVTADSSWTTADGSLALRHRLPVGAHSLRAVLTRDGVELGVGELEIRVDDRMRLSQVLVAPHPIRSEGAFTWMLSHAAHVHVDIFAVSGRQIQSLGPIEVGAGFGQLPWDGLDAGGQRVAAGTYLYVIRATNLEDPGVNRHHRGALVVMP